MSIWKKLFGSQREEDIPQQNNEESGRYMPKSELPLDERFILQFQENGGKFLYCLEQDEIYENIARIRLEQQWDTDGFFSVDKHLSKFIDAEKILYGSSFESSGVLLTSCENLIVQDGSILVSSRQIGENKLSLMPKDMIVIATTSQLVHTISDGLQQIKNSCKKGIPSNITTIKHFKEPKENNFLAYGSSAKNLYLLLLEDF